MMVKICSICENKKGEITKEYCPSNPLSPLHKEEPAYEHDGHWHLSQKSDCIKFSIKNLIINNEDV